MKIKPNIPNLTVICIAGNKHGESIASMYIAIKEINAARYVLITNRDIVLAGIDVINVGGLETWEAYNYFCVKELHKYFDTDYCLIIQWDGKILDGSLWDDSFLNFDYVASKWLDIGKPYNVGCGGISIRSKKLQKILATDPIIITTCPEDVAICRTYGQYLMDNHGIKFATEEVADKFSFELNEPTQPTFAMHSFHHAPYKQCVVLKREGAMGDVLMVEPLIDYYVKKKHRVFLDTQEKYMQMFIGYRHPVYHVRQLNPNIKPLKIDLDMAYEIKPKQPVLKSYYEIAGITDAPLRNCQLDFRFVPGEEMFKKYAVVHIDDTAMAHRNIRGIEWKTVVSFLNKKGYDVIQVGKGRHEDVGLHFNTEAIGTLLYCLKGASLFIGGDSGCGQIAVALGVPSILFFQSVNPEYRYNDFTNIKVIQNHCEKQHCYHEVVSTVGQDCFYNPQLPPCSIYTATQVIDKIKEML